MEEVKLLNNNIESDKSNITENREAKENLKQHQFMAESKHGAIFFKNTESQYILINNKFLEILGLFQEQVIGKDDYEILPDKKEAKKNIKGDQFVFKTGKPREVTKRVIDTKRKECWFHTIKLPQFDEQGNIVGLVGIIRDITERKKTEQAHAKIVEAEKKRAEELRNAYSELQESRDELVRSDKLAYTGRIAASIAHEIRNPLTNVTMSAQQIKRVIKPKHLRNKHIEIIERNVERINYLITELLNCARPPKLNIQPCNIHKLLKRVLSTLMPKISSQKIKIVKKFTFRPTKIKVDKEQIERVFSNLILNAIEAMPKGGKSTIITEFNEDLFVVKIQDTGRGIPEKDIIKIFDPFFSSKSTGVGLGLTLCYGIIVSHGGSIEVNSKPRQGTIFTVSLPVKENSTHTQREYTRT
ncbi:MAG: PAS domain S-box protein [Candidatus Omnitrophica bacterium]|nr:PAS domain S-box protein [Candidatus Omnitrophota bacterium]